MNRCEEDLTRNSSIALLWHRRSAFAGPFVDLSIDLTLNTTAFTRTGLQCEGVVFLVANIGYHLPSACTEAAAMVTASVMPH